MATHYFKINKDSKFIEEFSTWKDETNRSNKLYLEASQTMRNTFDIEATGFYCTNYYLQIDLTDKDKEKFKSQLKKDGTFRKDSQLSKKWLELTSDATRKPRPSLQMYIKGFPLAGRTASQVFFFNNQWYGKTTSSYEAKFESPDWLEEIKASDFYQALEQFQEGLK